MTQIHDLTQNILRDVMKPGQPTTSRMLMVEVEKVSLMPTIRDLTAVLIRLNRAGIIDFKSKKDGGYSEWTLVGKIPEAVHPKKRPDRISVCKRTNTNTSASDGTPMRITMRAPLPEPEWEVS